MKTRYINPLTGEHATPTMGAFAQLLSAGFCGLPYRSTDSTIYLVIEGNDLVIATHGRSFYILDNISPLRQLTPSVTTTDVHLFRPPAAERSVSQARIDYYLPKPASKVTIDILDAQGTVIRSFTGTPNEGGRGGRGGNAGSEAVPRTPEGSLAAALAGVQPAGR